jgi:hypothetical protein
MVVRYRLLILAIAVLAIHCGRKGPPLAPLHLVPVAPANVSVSRVGSEAQIRFDVPATNQNGPTPVAIDRVEVFAATVAAGAIRPANRELLTSKYRVATIPVKPPPVEGEAPPAETTPDTRPGPGERTTFVEALTPKTLEPVFTTPAPRTLTVTTPTPAASAPAAAAGAGTAIPGVPNLPGESFPIPPVPPLPESAIPAETGEETLTALPPILPLSAIPGTPIAALEVPAPTYAARIYTLRGVTKSGRPGPPSTRVELPLVDPPPQPTQPGAVATETSIVLTWPVPAATGPAIAYNIYKVGGPDPINGAPVAEGKYERAGVTFGTEECFTIRAVEKIGVVSLESVPSPPVCLTPLDTFPPAAPKGLSIVAGTGTMNLGWDANTEPDLAGYLILRGEAPGGTLQPLTPAPITATSYEDKTVKAGVRYIYAIVAVDKASPPNRSAPSPRVEETAR